jgi:hypothetical protein
MVFILPYSRQEFRRGVADVKHPRMVRRGYDIIWLMIIELFHEHHHFWTPERKRSLYLGLLLVVLALVIQINAGEHSARYAMSAPAAGDLFLDNLPIWHIGFVIVIIAILFWVFSCLLLVVHPSRLLFAIKAIALFIIFRAFFMNLTHLGLYPGAAMPGDQNVGWGFYRHLTFEGNFFFSGHTGFPFLLALIFWDNNFWRRFFVLATFFFAAAVLLAHVHYSIDVFAAPFIVYGIFAITAKYFPKDHALLLKAIERVVK